MPARPEEMKRLLAMAIFDADFRAKLAADPESSAKSVNVLLSGAQSKLLTDVGARLRTMDPSKFADMDISVQRKVDLVTGDVLAPAFHGSTSISW